MGSFIFCTVLYVSRLMHEKYRMNVQLGQVSSKFAAVTNGQDSSKFAAVKTVKLAVNLLQQKRSS